MKKSQRLVVIIDLQLREEQAALQALGRCQQQLQEQQRQLESLQHYRQQYQTNLAEQQRKGLQVGQLLELRAFADKLDKAIDGQQWVVSERERDVTKARETWEASHQRRKSLDKLRELARAEEQRLESKREQQEQDARASRSGRKDGTRRA